MNIENLSEQELKEIKRAFTMFIMKVVKNASCDFARKEALRSSRTVLLDEKIVNKVSLSNYDNGTFFNEDNPEIEKIMSDRLEKRKATQPLTLPSAGSVFRNPEGMYAGKLIEDMNLKGYTIGRAMVSEKHANFIVNMGNAKASDIKRIIDVIKQKALTKYGIRLHVEQRLINWEGHSENEKTQN